MLEHQVSGDLERSGSGAEGFKNAVNVAVKQQVANGHTGLEAANAIALQNGHAAASPEENGVQKGTLGAAQNAVGDLPPTDMERTGAGHSGAFDKQEVSPAVESAAHIVDSGQAQNNSGLSVGDADQAGGKDAGQAPGDGRNGSKHGSIDSSKDPKGKEGDKGERMKSRSSKDSRRDSRRDRSKSKASKDKEKKSSRRGTHSRSRSHSRRRKHRSPSKPCPPRKRRTHGSRSSSRSSSPSPRPRFSRGISPGAMPPRARHFGGMRRSPPPFSRGGPPPAGPWGYGGPPPYDPHGYGPPRGGYSPPRRWPGPGRSPPPYGYERPNGPYGPYGGPPPPRGSRSPPSGQMYRRNPTTGSPLYGPPPAAQGGPWERALPMEPHPAAQGKVWGARSGWDSVAPEALAPDGPAVRDTSLAPISDSW